MIPGAGSYLIRISLCCNHWPNMDLIKMESNTDGEIKPTYFLSDVKEEENCLTIMKTEGLHSMQLINLECDSNNDKVTSVGNVKEEGHSVSITFTSIETEEEDVGWKDEVRIQEFEVFQDREEPFIKPLGVEDDSSIICQQGYLIRNLCSGNGGVQLISQLDDVPEGSSSARLDSSNDCQQRYLIHDLQSGNEEEHLISQPDDGCSSTCDLCNGEEQICIHQRDIPDSNVNCQQDYVTCDVCNGSGYLMHGLPIARKFYLC